MLPTKIPWGDCEAPPLTAKYRVMLLGGARPNFMKLAALFDAFKTRSVFQLAFVHTGQHYDNAMSEVFLRELDLPPPDVFLGVGSGSHAEQTARVMLALEPVIFSQKPHLLVLVGDVNSTLAGALVGSKVNFGAGFVPLGAGNRPILAHIEAGLRSFDPTMPEEINRVILDRLADLLFTTSPEAADNLAREGIEPTRVFHVGNVMVDSLVKRKGLAERSKIREQLGIDGIPYAVMTVHRPSNVDDKDALQRVLASLDAVRKVLHVVFPLHPRTEMRLETSGLMVRLKKMEAVISTPPLSYLDFVNLMAHARVVLTDSGGIQEETSVLGVPCLTLRSTTERPVTLVHGTNRLVGLDPDNVTTGVKLALAGAAGIADPPPLWDGHAAERIVDVVARSFGVE